VSRHRAEQIHNNAGHAKWSTNVDVDAALAQKAWQQLQQVSGHASETLYSIRQERDSDDEKDREVKHMDQQSRS